MNSLSVSLADKKKDLAGIISRQRSVAVACSGGVDSSLLLKVGCDVLGRENVIALFADTPLLPPGENDAVREIVNHIGCRLHVVSLNPLAWPEFIANPLERCYLCKKKIYQAMKAKLTEINFHVLMDGTNLDDLSDFRPGLKALEELEVKKPLADAGLTKKDIRRLSRELNLPTWNRYSSSCLATRIATAQKITREKLDLIRGCEGFLESIGFMGCRVRISGDFAVIELLEEDIERFVQVTTRRSVMKIINDFGIEKVFLNMSGRKGIIV